MGNAERNSFVKQEILRATVSLLERKGLEEISVSEITAAAHVSRNSFYRNYASKEEILKDHVRALLRAWDTAYKQSGQTGDPALFGSLFAHLKENGGFYGLLKKRGVFHLFLEALLDLYGAKPEHDNMTAYTVSFIIYGLFGWIEEWLARGMQEAAEDMAQMLAAHGMK